MILTIFLCQWVMVLVVQRGGAQQLPPPLPHTSSPKSIKKFPSLQCFKFFFETHADEAIL
jgi:hypothetical protein